MFILADNHDLARSGMRSFVLRASNGGAICEAFSKKELAAAMSKSQGGVVILDYTSFDFNGIEDLLIFHKRFGGYAWVMCSQDLSEDFIRRMGAEENVSIIFYDSPGADILRAIESAIHGGRHLSPQVETLLRSERGHKEIEDVLTHTEIEILKLIARGMSVKEIAAERISSAHTITTHKKNIFRKLGVNNVYEATKYALRAGLLEMVEYYI